jgi:hypothetical protein
VTWPCGECGVKWPDAVPRCAACDADEIDRQEKRVIYLESVMRDVVYALRNQDDLTREDIAGAMLRDAFPERVRT